MENAVQIRGATAQDAQVFFALNWPLTGRGWPPPEAALALAHPGPERVLLAFVAGDRRGLPCGLLKRSACYSRPSVSDGADAAPCRPEPWAAAEGCRRLTPGREAVRAHRRGNSSIKARCQIGHWPQRGGPPRG